MKHYRLNQIAMAVLGALLLFFGAKILINIAYEEHEPEEPGYEVAGSEEHPGGGEVKPGGGDQLATLLASADPTRGADVAKKCAICHNFDKGGPNLIGPNLYGVLGRKIASHEGYEYSDALKSKGSDSWDYEKINHMIENPNAFAPGTKMALFPGLPDAKQRADVIVFLRTKNDNPPPLPEPTAGGGATAGGGKASPAARRRAAERLPAARKSSRCWRPPTRNRARPTLDFARSATNSRRGERRWSVPTFMASSDARSLRSRASTTRPR